MFWRWDASAGSWVEQASSGEAVAVGEDVAVENVSRSADEDNALWLWRDGFIVPDTLELANAESLCDVTETLKATSHTRSHLPLHAHARTHARTHARMHARTHTNE